MSSDLPQAANAERAVIGCILIHGESIVLIADWLQASDFHDKRCGVAYAAALALHERRDPIDLVTVLAELTARQDLAASGGAVFLSKMVNAVATPTAIEAYAQLVQAAAERRRLLQVGAEIARLAHQGEGAGTDLQAQALAALLAAGPPADRSVPGREASSRLMDELGRLARSETAFPVFGLPSLDEVVMLRPASVTYIGAYTSEGKTALALTTARNNAQAGQHVFYVSTEMRPEDLARRHVCAYTGIPFRRLCERLSDNDMHHVAEALGQIGEWPGRIDYLGGAVTVERLRLEALARKASGRLDLLVVDYVQKVQAEGRNFHEQITRVSNTLQVLAQELDTPVLAVSQLSRKTLTKDEPTLDDMAESGTQERDADAVILLRRDPEHGQGTFRVVQWWVRKNRNGPLGDGALWLDTVKFTFEEIK